MYFYLTCTVEVGVPVEHTSKTGIETKHRTTPSPSNPLRRDHIWYLEPPPQLPLASIFSYPKWPWVVGITPSTNTPHNCDLCLYVTPCCYWFFSPLHWIVFSGLGSTGIPVSSILTLYTRMTTIVVMNIGTLITNDDYSRHGHYRVVSASYPAAM